MKIFIENLSFDCIIGILPHERVKKQRVIINLNFKYNYKNKDFIDYWEVLKNIELIMIEKKFELLEEAILFIKKFLKKRYPITKLKLKISKPHIIKNCMVSLSNS